MQERSQFKFGLYLKNEVTGNQVVSERSFDADVYNQPTRYTVNIKPFSHEIISSFQKVLSTKTPNLTLKTYVGKNQTGKRVVIDHTKYDYNFDYPKELHEAFTFTLRINDNIIIERDFTVMRFNPNSIFSEEVMSLVNSWVGTINEHIKKTDVAHMWQEYALIERYGLQVSDIRTMEREKKEHLLSKIGQN